MALKKQVKNNSSIASPISSTITEVFMEHSPDAIIAVNEENEIIFWNKKAGNIFGFTREEIIGKPLFTIIPEECEALHPANFTKLFESRKSVLQGKVIELEGLKKNGLKISIEMSLNGVKERSHSILFAIIRDISKRVLLQQKLRQQAITDSLTGLYNRRYFDKMLKFEFTRSRRYKKPFAVIITDIDGFKQANDLFDHFFGDKVLIKATKIIQEGLRTVDTVFRYGGGEFAIILPETSRESAFDIAERLRSNFAKKGKIKNKRIKLALSIGLACFPEDGKNEKDMVSIADRRMYHSKNEGGNIVTAYTVSELIGAKYEALLKSLTSLTVLMEESRPHSPWLGVSHSQKTRALAMDMGRMLGLSAARVSLIEQASMLHDIGSLFISRTIFNKVGKITREDMVEIKKHPLIGEEILDMILTSSSDNNKMKDLPKVIGQHHEWVNGKGYPRRLKGNDLLMEAKILHVADAYEAMSSERPHRGALNKKQISKEFEKLSGKQFDPVVVRLLFKIESL